MVDFEVGKDAGKLRLKKMGRICLPRVHLLERVWVVVWCR